MIKESSLQVLYTDTAFLSLPLGSIDFNILAAGSSVGEGKLQKEEEDGHTTGRCQDRRSSWHTNLYKSPLMQGFVVTVVLNSHQYPT